jgi:hypothetical protein
MKKFSITLAQKEALDKQVAALMVTAVLSVVSLAAAQAACALTEAKNEASNSDN